MEAPRGFCFAQDDSTVVITYLDDTTLELKLDGRKVDAEWGDGIESRVKAKWNGNDFVTEREVGGVAKITDRYFHAVETDQLFVITQLDIGPPGRRRRIDFRRVFDRVPE